MTDAVVSWCALCRDVRTSIGQQHRYAHSVRVARLADQLAQRHGINPAKARTAGILHDIARLWPASELIAACRQRDMHIDDFEAQFPVVLHARVGAALVRERYAISDPEILSAIEKHTVAAPEMSALDAIIFIADTLEPGRSFAGREELLELAFDDLYAGLRGVYVSTMEFLQRCNLQAAPQLLAAMHRYERTAP